MTRIGCLGPKGEEDVHAAQSGGPPFFSEWDVHSWWQQCEQAALSLGACAWSLQSGVAVGAASA